MARTSVTEVKKIIPTDMSDTDIQAYMDTATALVDAYLSGSLPDALLVEIEKWITAHLMSTTRLRQLKSGKAGPASATYFGEDGKGLGSSTYGQQAILLDSTGTLARQSEGRPSNKLEAL